MLAAAGVTMMPAGAGDAPGDGVGRSNRSAARGLERDAEGVRALVADDEGIVGGENRLEIAAGKVHDAGVAGGDVTVGIGPVTVSV